MLKMNVSDAKVVMLKGEKGSDIASIEKTASDGLVDSYTITLTDGEKHTFNVANGSSIASIKKTSSSGLTDTYTVTLTNGNTTTFNVANGNGITGIEKTSTNALVDTYTINYSNGSYGTFSVTNGRGIVSIEKTGSSGINDTYTITYNDGTTSTYNVVNADAKELTDKFNTLEGMTTGKFVSGTACVAGNYYIADDKLYKCIANTDGTIPVTNTAYFKQTTVMNEVKVGVEYVLLAEGNISIDTESVTVALNDSIDNYRFIMGCIVYSSSVSTRIWGTQTIAVGLFMSVEGFFVINAYDHSKFIEVSYKDRDTVNIGYGNSTSYRIYGIK